MPLGAIWIDGEYFENPCLLAKYERTRRITSILIDFANEVVNATEALSADMWVIATEIARDRASLRIATEGRLWPNVPPGMCGVIVTTGGKIVDQRD